LPLMIGTLGCVVACASLLGIEEPSERVNSEADGAAGTPDASDAGSALAPDVDAATINDAVPTDDAAADGGFQVNESGMPTLGVPCGLTSCTGAFVCCYGPSPTRCMLPSDCSGLGGNPVACDGPEDCASHQVCCAEARDGGGFALQCETQIDCKGPVACHVLASVCDCKAPAPPCLPVPTCEGRCL
jgi:hypothetical protein